MAWRSLPLLACAAGFALSAAAASDATGRVSAAAWKFQVLVFPDRTNPDLFVLVDDFRVNDTITNPKGDRFFVLTTREGTFQLPFENVAEIEFTALRDSARPDTTRYDVRVVLPVHGVRRGTMELHSMSGRVRKSPWRHQLTAPRENGQALHRLLFVKIEE